MRYIPTLRTPVRGWRVMTRPKVMNGPPSSGQQVRTGRSRRDGRSTTTSWHAPRSTIFGAAAATSRRSPSSLSLSIQPLGGASFISFRTRSPSWSRDETPSAQLIRSALPKAFIRTGIRCRLTFSNNSAGPPHLTMRSASSVISSSALTGARARPGGPMLASFGPVAILLIVALIFAVVPLILGRFTAPKNPDRVKLQPYESGMKTIGPTHIQFRTRYYLYALIFVIFDVEAIYLFPWAVAFNHLGLFALVEMAIFIGFLLVAFGYAWRKGALDWR